MLDVRRRDKEIMKSQKAIILAKTIAEGVLFATFILVSFALIYVIGG